MSLIGPEGRKQLELAARFLSAGIELAVCVVVGYFAGNYADKWLNTAPYLGFLGLLLGIAAGFRALFTQARAAHKQAETSSPNDPPPDPPA
jgi:ATP synthase protein I